MSDLKKYNIPSTPNRELVYKVLLKYDRAISMSEIEAELKTVDRSSIFRVLKLFHEKKVIHIIDDGSSVTKYALCQDGNHNPAFHSHAHFYCERCKRIITLNADEVVPVTLPEGFTANEINYVVHGICHDCNEELS